MEQNIEILRMAQDLVINFGIKNTKSTADVLSLISKAYQGYHAILEGKAQNTPAVPSNTSISQNSITCLECGKKYKSLKRHIRTSHDLSPEQYREKWSLAANYPMTAPGYAAKRSKIAKNHGLGKQAVVEPDIGSGQVDGTANLKSNSKKNQLHGSFHNRALRPSPVP